MNETQNTETPAQRAERLRLAVSPIVRRWVAGEITESQMRAECREVLG